MKLSNLFKFYQMTKNWELIDSKISIPEQDLPKLDIRDGKLILKEDYNPNATSPRGVFMPDMTEDDWVKYQQQTSGWKKFYDKVKGVK